MRDLLIHNADMAGRGRGWLLARQGRISDTGAGDVPDALLHLHDTLVVDAGGRLLLPGAIDCHVHFREPGLTQNADIATESRAAVAGGVTSYFDMPNTVPQTTDARRMAEKSEIAARCSAANYAFFPGATNDNIDALLALPTETIPGIKLFLGSSTGNMLVNSQSALDRLFAGARVPIVVHAEDEDIIAANTALAVSRYGSREAVPVTEHPHIRSVEACVAATARAIALAEKHDAHLHIAHLSTADEVDMVREARSRGLAKVTCEVSPHHLLFCAEDFVRLGTRIKMNPSVKDAAHRQALRDAVVDGTVDIIATDHAPHLAARKQGGALTAASGAPMVQFSVPAMLQLFGPEAVRRCMCEAPARLFGIVGRGTFAKGAFADLVLYDRRTWTVTDDAVLSKCAWTPLAGSTLEYSVALTLVNGEPVYLSPEDGNLCSYAALVPDVCHGAPIVFRH